MHIITIGIFIVEHSDSNANNDMHRTNYIKICSHIHANTRLFKLIYILDMQTDIIDTVLREKVAIQLFATLLTSAHNSHNSICSNNRMPGEISVTRKG